MIGIGTRDKLASLWISAVLASLAFLPSGAMAADKSEKEDASEMIQTAIAHSLRSAGTFPFAMKVTGKIYGYSKGPVEIDYETRWWAPDSWFDQISAGGFVQRRLVQGDKLWMQRNAPFLPLRVAQLERMLELAGLRPLPDDEAKGIEDHGREEKRLRCPKMASPFDSYKLCFDEQSRLAREERTSLVLYPNQNFSTNASQSAPPVETAYEYSDYADWNGKAYPKSLRILEDGKPVLEAEVQQMAPEPKIVAGAVPPPKALEPQLWCSDPKPAHIVHLSRELPHSATLIGGFSTQGRIVVSGVIDPQGALSDENITLRSTRGLDDAIRLTLRDWIFQPAMCGQKAIAQDIFFDLAVEPRSGFMVNPGSGSGPR